MVLVQVLLAAYKVELNIWYEELCKRIVSQVARLITENLRKLVNNKKVSKLGGDMSPFQK